MSLLVFVTSSCHNTIPAKLTKEVRDLTKFFKKNNLPKGKKSSKKSYTQALLAESIVRETLKIKEMLPKLHTSKIKNIQNIISRGDKPKPQINMTTSDPSRKQVIIPINQDNIAKFIKNSSI